MKGCDGKRSIRFYIANLTKCEENKNSRSTAKPALVEAFALTDVYCRHDIQNKRTGVLFKTL